MDCNLADQGVRKLLEGGQRWLGGGVEAVEGSGGGQDVGQAAWSGVRRRPGRGWKQQGKVDEKNGGSNKGTDELHVKPCCQTKKKQSKSRGKNRTSSPRKIGAHG